MEYNVTISKKGQPYYYLNGKRISESRVPNSVVERSRSELRPMDRVTFRSDEDLEQKQENISEREELPADVVRTIFTFGDPAEIFNLCSTSKSWSSRCQSPEFWNIYFSGQQERFEETFAEAVRRHDINLVRLLWETEFTGIIQDRSKLGKILIELILGKDLQMAEIIANLDQNSSIVHNIWRNKTIYIVRSRIINDVINKDFERLLDDYITYFMFTVEALAEYGDIELIDEMILSLSITINKFHLSHYLDSLVLHVIRYDRLKLLNDIDDSYGINLSPNLFINILSSTDPEMIFYGYKKRKPKSTELDLADIADIIESYVKGSGGVILRYEPLRKVYLRKYPEDVENVIVKAYKYMNNEEILYYLDDILRNDRNLATEIATELIQLTAKSEEDYLKAKIMDWMKTNNI